MTTTTRPARSVSAIVPAHPTDMEASACISPDRRLDTSEPAPLVEREPMTGCAGRGVHLAPRITSTPEAHETRQRA